MNVYDFDNTIYKGESTLDYYFYCVKHHPRLLRFVFIVLYELVKYKMCLVTEDELMALCRRYVMAFLKDCPDAEWLAQKFWDKNFGKIKRFYFDVCNESDIVLSASFGFMLRPVMKRLGISSVVCSEVNLETGEIERLCFRRNKKALYDELYGEPIENFYTDSLNDMPLIEASERAYIVKNEKITEWRK